MKRNKDYVEKARKASTEKEELNEKICEATRSLQKQFVPIVNCGQVKSAVEASYGVEVKST